MYIINHKKFFLGLSAFLVLASVALIAYFGLNVGIDFKGGSMTEVTYTSTRPDVETIHGVLEPLGVGEALVQPSGTDSFFIKTRYLSETERVAVIDALSIGGTAQRNLADDGGGTDAG